MVQNRFRAEGAKILIIQIANYLDFSNLMVQNRFRAEGAKILTIQIAS